MNGRAGFLGVVAIIAGGAAVGAYKYMTRPDLAKAALTTRELPGFSIGMPSGTKATEHLDYNEGQLQLNDVLGTGNVSEVQWEAGAVFSTDEVDMFAKGMAASLPGTAISAPETSTGPHGEKVISVVLRTSKGPIFASIMACGGRRIILMNGSDSKMETLQHRMIASIACHPDKAKEASLGALPWTVDLPAGWTQMPAQAGQVALTDGDDALLARGIEKMPSHADLPKVLSSLIAAAGVHMTIGEWTGDRFPAQATFDGKPMAGFVLPIECHGSAVLLLGFSPSADGAGKLADLVKTKGRCLAPGEPPPPWPKAH